MKTSRLRPLWFVFAAQIAVVIAILMCGDALRPGSTIADIEAGVHDVGLLFGRPDVVSWGYGSVHYYYVQNGLTVEWDIKKKEIRKIKTRGDMSISGVSPRIRDVASFFGFLNAVEGKFGSVSYWYVEKGLIVDWDSESDKVRTILTGTGNITYE